MPIVYSRSFYQLLIFIIFLQYRYNVATWLTAQFLFDLYALYIKYLLEKQFMIGESVTNSNIKGKEEEILPNKGAINNEIQKYEAHPDKKGYKPDNMQNIQQDSGIHPKASSKSMLTSIQYNEYKINLEQKKQSKQLKKVNLIFRETISGSILNKIKDGRKFQGFKGHTTVIFKRPIIEGQYYLEFKVLPSPLSNANSPLRQQQACRIGICSPNYLMSCPLGKKNSIGFKLKTGHLISNSKIQSHHNVSAKVNDIFGLLIKFSSPYKHQNKNDIWEGSCLEVRRNNETICKYNKISQDFYCPAFSLFNYGSMEVRINEDELEYLPEGYKAYGEIYFEPILYQNLKNSNVFSQFAKRV